MLIQSDRHGTLTNLYHERRGLTAARRSVFELGRKCNRALGSPYIAAISRWRGKRSGRA